jgi:hypothetical protein
LDWRYFRLLDLRERLLEVGDKVVWILQADGESYEIRRDAGSAKLLVGKLPMGVRRRVEHAALGVSDMGHYADELE